MGRYIVLEPSDPPRAAEVAFVVEEDYQGQGLASILLQHLIGIARRGQLVRFEAEVLPANRAMLRVFQRSGLAMETNPSSDSIHLTLFLDPQDTAPPEST